MWRKTVVLVVLSLVIVGNTVAKGEEQIISKIFMSIERIDENLKSPFAKAGLELTVWNFYKARIALSPNKYEMTKDFKQGFLQAFSVFKKRLWLGGFEGLKSKFRNSYLNEMIRSYNKNRANFLKLTESLAKTTCFPPNFSSDLIIESQIYFSLLLLDVDKHEWSKAKKFTYIFPFCG